MKLHTDFLNALIEKHNLNTYVEIGIFHTDHNFNKIKCPSKIGVDPEYTGTSESPIFKGTSDEFFENPLFSKITSKMFFIDGLHHAEQVKKDFKNCLSRLDEGGFIMMHDCNPHSENITHVPRDNREWCGDTYKFACQLSKYGGIEFVTINEDYGCTLVWKNDNKSPTTDVGVPPIEGMTWGYFQANKEILLNLISVKQFKEKFLC